MIKEKIAEPTGCFACGINADGFSFCVSCGTDKFMKGIKEPMEYVKLVNPDRFNMIMKWYEQQKEDAGNIERSL